VAVRRTSTDRRLDRQAAVRVVENLRFVSPSGST
jgi:hypothetical protein